MAAAVGDHSRQPELEVTERTRDNPGFTGAVGADRPSENARQAAINGWYRPSTGGMAGASLFSHEDRLCMLLMIDNYDSFTYNLVQYFGELGQEVRVFRNDAISLAEIARLDPALLVISPGPCTPAQAGISLAAIREFAGRIPLLGVCLGHQAIGEAFGGRVVHAHRLMHGKVSPVEHSDQGVFRGLPNPLTCTRYHSLAVERHSLPDCLEITAWTDDGEIMGLRHRTLAVEGVQFHPESILTERGHDLLKNFLEEHHQ
ncbi:MAG: Anthranilate synthase component II [Candidatus Accumulibacter regalis]|jgi:anthranilate synthase component 2|uniref:Anthranilate synthase component II n=2 Tax=Candidatus Accumulibacter TaxID=327159 RepID=A0A011QIH9_ACCRE|nr:MAG: Anthranilate synthase component II [Candidatus Accumulibacter regalis]